MAKDWVFDRAHTRRLVEARQRFLGEVLPPIIKKCSLGSALDVGCGLGDFSSFLRDLGLEVTGVDARQGNIEEAARRLPDIQFKSADVEDVAVRELGIFDLVLCVGLLYHLENPFRAIRNMQDMTRSVLFIETRAIPRRAPLLQILDEGSDDDQSLRSVSLYASEEAVVKLLYRSGFPFVYRVAKAPRHEEFVPHLTRKRMRTVLFASKVPLDQSALVLASDDRADRDPWLSLVGRAWASVGPLAGRIGRGVGSRVARRWGGMRSGMRRRQA